MDEAHATKVVYEVITEVFELEPGEVDEGDDLLEDLGGDSLKVLELVSILEKRLKIRYPPADPHNLETVRDVLDVTRRHACR